jgi:hypothetical protein
MDGFDTDGNKNLLWVYLAELTTDFPKQVGAGRVQTIGSGEAFLAEAVPEDKNVPGWPGACLSPIIYPVTFYVKLLALKPNYPDPKPGLHPNIPIIRYHPVPPGPRPLVASYNVLFPSKPSYVKNDVHWIAALVTHHVFTASISLLTPIGIRSPAAPLPTASIPTR